MALGLENRQVGNVTVVTCRGRLAAVPESAALQQHLDALFPISPHIVLHLGEIDFIDSGGLGLLVRLLTRAKHAHGHLSVCAISAKIENVLKTTRLRPIFQAFETEADAIAAADQIARRSDLSFLNANVLCVDQSQDVLAYLRELLTEAGYHVLTAANLPDALTLLQATQPKVIVIGTKLREARGTRAAGEFNTLADAYAVVELAEGFSSHDAGEAAEQVLRAVRSVVKGESSEATKGS